MQSSNGHITEKLVSTGISCIYVLLCCTLSQRTVQRKKQTIPIQSNVSEIKPAMEGTDLYYRELCSSETLRSGTKGFFRDFTEVVVNKAGTTWITNIFGKLKNDDERMRMIFTHPNIKNSVVDTLNRVRHVYRDKDARISRTKRLESEHYASIGDHNKGLITLSQAVLRAPTTGAVKAIDDGYSLPLALLARADVLMAIGEFEYVLDDLKAATEDNLPSNIRKDITEDETVRFKSYLMSMGIDDPVTRDAYKTSNEYFRQLAVQLAQILEEPLNEVGGMMTLTDVYCRVNRARGLELLSPEDLLNASRQLAPLNLPGLISVLDSGLKDRGSITADELAQSAGISIVLACERLLVTEKYGKACRDDTIEALRAQIDAKLTDCNRRFEESCKSVRTLTTAGKNPYCKPVPPELTNGPNPEFPGLSRLVEIHESPDVGRYAVASGDVRVGDTLATESPLASCLLPDYYGTHCHHCFVRLRAPLGCPDCSTVAFCGIECRNEAMKSYHQYECKILVLLIGSGMSILSTLALRMVTQVGLQTCLKLHRKCKEELKNKKNDELQSQEDISAKLEENMSKSAKRRLRRKKLLENIQQMKSTPEVDFRAYELVTHESLRSAGDFFERTLMAAFLLKCLMTVDFFGNTRENIESPTAEELTIGALLLRNLQLLQFNAHEIFETRSSNKHRFRGNKTVYLGIAIYPSVARLNHDCYPAVTRYFTGRDIVIRATRPLKLGEVVAENYGPIFTKRSLKERQRVLNGRYWFKCTCTACTQNWPDFDGLIDYSPRYRCTTEECRGSLHRLKQGNPSAKCMVCQRKIHLKERIVNLEACEQEYKRGFMYMEEERSDEALQQVTQALEKFHINAWPPHRDTHLAEIALATCMAENGNTWRLFTE